MTQSTKLWFLFVFWFLSSVSLAPAQPALININTATLAELDTLPGVGPSVAQSIIDNRPYAAIQEISRASGIGEPGSSSYENIINLITVGEITSSPEEESEENEDVSTSSSSSSAGSSSGPTSSPFKTTEPAFKFNIGKDRTVSIGEPLQFKVETNLNYTRNSIFKWNFGDGSEGFGEVLNHTYEYPGEYTVILSIAAREVQGLSRTNVKVIEPELLITMANRERIELKNNSQYEINLFGRALEVGGNVFIFPLNTMVRAGRPVSFSSKVTGLYPTQISAVSVLILGGVESSKISAKVTEEKLKQSEAVRNKILDLQGQLESIYAAQSNKSSLPVIPPPEAEKVTVAEDIELYKSESQTATALKTGWLQTLKRFFLRAK